MTVPQDPRWRPQAPPTAPQWQPPTMPQQGPPMPPQRPLQRPPWMQQPPIHPDALRFFRERNADRARYRWNHIWWPLILTGGLVLMVLFFVVVDAIA